MYVSNGTRIGLVGLGRMGLNHLRVLSLLKGADVRFVYDSDAETRDRIASSTGICVVGGIEEMFGAIDALIITSPTVTHSEYVVKSAGAVQNIFVEKPIAHSLEAARELEKLACDKNLKLQVGFIERFNPAVQQLKKVLDGSELVSLDFMRTSKVSSRITDVDVILDLMIHDIDLAIYLNGPVERVVAHGVATDHMVELASAVLTHKSGKFSRVLASRVTEKKIRSIQATCRDMFVDCDLLRKEIHISRQSQVVQPDGEPYTITALDETLEVRPHEALLLELQAFLELCAGTADPNVPGPRDGREAMEVCEAIRQAIAST